MERQQGPGALGGETAFELKHIFNGGAIDGVGIGDGKVQGMGVVFLEQLYSIGGRFVKPDRGIFHETLM